MSYTKFTGLVKDLDKKGKELSFQVNEVNDIEGRKESIKLQLISNQYQYLIFFFFCIIMFLFIIRLLTYDTGIIDTIILIIVLLFPKVHATAKYLPLLENLSLNAPYESESNFQASLFGSIDGNSKNFSHFLSFFITS